MIGDYRKMWEDYAARKAGGYLTDRFDCRSASGLKNFVREKIIFEMLALRKEDVFLDVGCASGRQVFLASDLCEKAVGVDVAENFINKAKETAVKNNMKNVEFFAAPLEKLPFPDESFNVVLCAEVIEHLPDSDLGTSELRRVLKNGGRLVVSVPNENGQGTYWKRAKNKITGKKFEPLKEFTLAAVERHGDAHVRVFNAATVRDFLNNRGFLVEKIKGASVLDTPFFDFGVNIVNRSDWIKNRIVDAELFLARRAYLSNWGRQLVALAWKK